MAKRATDIPGIHHITALARDPQTNLDFYTRVLGLRLVKKTVNFDDPGTCHLYYGDELGHPGTIMTFFPWPGAAPGSRGTGQATVTAFRVPEGSLGYWGERLARLGADADEVFTRTGMGGLLFHKVQDFVCQAAALGIRSNGLQLSPQFPDCHPVIAILADVFQCGCDHAHHCVPA